MNWSRLRSAQSGDRTNPLYLKRPELWLEAQVRLALRNVDASLEAGPVYRQAPALTCGDRSVLDLLAVDYAGRLAVVEVKVSEDLHLPLQALDYWIRVQWHAARMTSAPPATSPASHCKPNRQGFFWLPRRCSYTRPHNRLSTISHPK